MKAGFIEKLAVEQKPGDEGIGFVDMWGQSKVSKAGKFLWCRRNSKRVKMAGLKRREL